MSTAIQAVPAAQPDLFKRLTAPKSLITMLITLILVVGEWRFGAMGGYRKLVLTVGTCVLTELTLGLFIRGALPPLQSAYISGVSLSLLLLPRARLLLPLPTPQLPTRRWRCARRTPSPPRPHLRQKRQPARSWQRQWNRALPLRACATFAHGSTRWSRVTA